MTGIVTDLNTTS